MHHGYLGHSYLGSWVNFGAGTSNSDLKNTYGPVNMEYRGRKIGTGMQFVGCFVGDYVKTAINTSIFTGKTIGVCSMVYGFVTANVPAFCNYAKTVRPSHRLAGGSDDRVPATDLRPPPGGATRMRRAVAPRSVRNGPPRPETARQTAGAVKYWQELPRISLICPIRVHLRNPWSLPNDSFGSNRRFTNVHQ